METLSKKNTWLFICFFLFILLSYVFFASAGRFLPFTEHLYSYYGMLSDSFLHGRLSLLVDTPPELVGKNILAMDQDLKNKVLWDTAFFEDHFYIYHGPFPAVLIAFFKVIGFSWFADRHIAFMFQYLRLLAFSYLLFLVVKNAKLKLVLPVFLCAIATAAWVTPFPYVLGRSTVYEAAISSSQFFLVLGLLCLYLALAKSEEYLSTRLLLFGSTSFALVLGCRVSLLPAVMLFLAFTFLFFCWKLQKKINWIKLGFLLFLPVTISIGILALYNFERFHNPFQFGTTYMNTLGNPDNIFSKRFFFANVWNYLFRLPDLQRAYPFFKMPMSWGTGLPDFIPYPSGYITSEPMIGLLPGIPIFICVILGSMRFFRRTISVGEQIQPIGANQWLILGALILGLTALFTNLCVNAFSMRYLEDFLPALLVSGFAALLVDPKLQQKSLSEKTFLGIMLVFTIYSCIVGVLLWTDSNVQMLPRFNPELYMKLVNFFGT